MAGTFEGYVIIRQSSRCANSDLSFFCFLQNLWPCDSRVYQGAEKLQQLSAAKIINIVGKNIFMGWVHSLLALVAL